MIQYSWKDWWIQAFLQWLPWSSDQLRCESMHIYMDTRKDTGMDSVQMSLYGVQCPWRWASVSTKVKKKRHHQTNPEQWRQTPPVNPRAAGPVVTSWTVSSVQESWSKSDCCHLTALRQRRPATTQRHRFTNHNKRLFLKLSDTSQSLFIITVQPHQYKTSRYKTSHDRVSWEKQTLSPEKGKKWLKALRNIGIGSLCKNSLLNYFQSFVWNVYWSIRKCIFSHHDSHALHLLYVKSWVTQMTRHQWNTYCAGYIL